MMYFIKDVFVCQLCTVEVEVPHVCNEQRIAALKQRLTYILAALTAAQKLQISRAVLYEIAQHNALVALKLKAEYLREAAGSAEDAAQLSFDWWSDVIELYPDTEPLKALVLYKAAASTDLARVFYGNAPLIAKAVIV